MITLEQSKELNKGIKANDYILGLRMNTLRRFGIDSVEFNVFTDNHAMIGTYNPVTNIYRPIFGCWNCFSKELLNKIMDK